MAGANMSRNESLAGQSVKQGGYTVTYDKNGYAKKAVKDGGASATSSKKTTHANDSAYHQEAYQAAQAGDWDAAGVAVNKIGMAGGVNADGTFDMADANKYMQELQDQFKYNANDYYNQKYDDTYGAGSSNVWDATNGSVKTIDQWNALTGGAAVPSQDLTTGGLAYGTGGDASQYLQEMYAQQIAAQLATLKSTYEQNVADIRAQDDLITSTYDKQRNQAAAQNDLQRMYMNEMGLMQGLNTGATGQMALAQSAALQGNLATIGSQEAQSLADNALNLTKLTAQYKNAADQAAAEGNSQLAQALYNEYVRQDELARQAAANAQEQANWLEKFNYQKEQDALAQKNWQAQFDYQKAQDDLNYRMALMKLNARNGTSGTTGATSTRPGYNNGGLTSDQVKVLQNYYGVTADGLWGSQSSKAAGGLTADQAWQQYSQNGVQDLSNLDTDSFTNSHSDNMVRVDINGSTTYMTWSSAQKYVQSGVLKVIPNGDGTYTLQGA